MENRMILQDKELYEIDEECIRKKYADTDNGNHIVKVTNDKDCRENIKNTNSKK